MCVYQCCEGKCNRKCGEPCYECMNKCKLECRHSKCQALCSVICKRKPCDYPCEKELPCGHECMGLCGEQCLKACKICQPDHIIFQFLGAEDEPEARFYALECGDVFEVKSLDQYMGYGEEEKKQEDTNKLLQYKTCPKCKTCIKKSNRYQAQIKKVFRFISDMKRKLVNQNSIGLEKMKQLEIEAQTLMMENKEREKFLKKITLELEKEINKAKKKNMYFNYFYLTKFSDEYKKNMKYALSIKNEKSFEAVSYFLQVKNLGDYYLGNEHVDINDEQWEKVQIKLKVLTLFRQLKNLIMNSLQREILVNKYLKEIIKNNFFLNPQKIEKRNEFINR